MRAVILVPRRADGGRRDALWEFTRAWLTRNHPDYDLFEGASPDGPFNRGAAINAAARAAGDWDVAVVHDGDNFLNPRRLVEAIGLAHSTGIAHIAHSTYLYLPKDSSDEILANPAGPWWPDLQINDANPNVDRERYNRYAIHRHVSGVVAIPKRVWAATNGFAELTGWGSEDSLHIVMCNALGGGVRWVPGACFHLWHEHNPEDINRVLRKRNRDRLLLAKHYEHNGDLAALKRHLVSIGHHVP
jgi:hypothetical protein